MLTLLRRLLFGSRPETRMTEQEVKMLADRAAEVAHIDRTLGFITVRSINGRITWVASTPTIGSGWSVTIDDATGEVGAVRRWGIR
jgi:hypothetical protein